MLGDIVGNVPGSTGGSAGFSVIQSPLQALASGLPGVNNIVASGAVDANGNPLPSSGNSLIDIINAVGQNYNLNQQQQQFAQQNIDLINRGYPPMSWQQFTGAPTASAAPQGTYTGGSLSLSPTMMLLIGAVAIFAFTKKRRA